MLFVLCGAAGKAGKKSAAFLRGEGLKEVRLLICASDTLTENVSYDGKKAVSKEEFEKKADSLFRYETGGVTVGYDRSRIMRAVGGASNGFILMTHAPKAELLREIKKVYGDAVRIIYCYDAAPDALSDSAAWEDQYVAAIAEDAKRVYLRDPGAFDFVVIYDGQREGFDHERLAEQLGAIIRPLVSPEKKPELHDVYILYARKDAAAAKTVRGAFEARGLDVVDDEDVLDLSSEDFAGQIRDAIASSRVVVPIMSKDSVKSPFIKREVSEALDVAEESATVVVALYLDKETYETVESGDWYLPLWGSTLCEGGNVGKAADELAAKIKDELLDGVDRLERLSEMVNGYVRVKNYEAALELQREHRDRCASLSIAFNGKYVDLDAILHSQMRLIGILMDMERWEEALRETVEGLAALDQEVRSEYYDGLKELFAICCVECGYGEKEVEELINGSVNTYSADEKYLGKLMDRFNYDLCMELMEAFRLKKAQKKKKKSAAGKKKKKAAPGEADRIAGFGEAAMSIFDGLTAPVLTEKARDGMIEGYQRILNYCIHLGISGMIPDECIKRIAELRAVKTAGAKEDVELTGALKVYLGQAAPGSGSYDAFISFKSADEALARKVYEFLLQNGMEVFFSEETLNEIGNSDYESEIFDAIDHSRHFILVGTDPEYFKTEWVSREWKHYYKKWKSRKVKGNLVMVMPDEQVKDTKKLPPELVAFQIIKLSEFRRRLLPYLR